MRWYSGRTAREQPCDAASLMCAEAATKLASGSRGYMMPFSGLGWGKGRCLTFGWSCISATLNLGEKDSYEVAIIVRPSYTNRRYSVLMTTPVVDFFALRLPSTLPCCYLRGSGVSRHDVLWSAIVATVRHTRPIRSIRRIDNLYSEL